MNILIFILAGTILFFLFRLGYKLSSALIKKKALRAGMQTSLPLVELLAWITYLFWGVLVFFGDHLYYDLIVVVMAVLIVFGLAWYVFRDILAGVLLKTEKSLEPGQVIKTQIVEGKIKKTGTRFLELINDKGETVKVPYSRLSNELIIIPPENEESLPHQLLMVFTPEQQPEKIKEQVISNLFAMPWIISPHPKVKLIKTNEGEHAIHVTYHTHNRTHAVMVEEKLRKLVNAVT